MWKGLQSLSIKRTAGFFPRPTMTSEIDLFRWAWFCSHLKKSSSLSLRSTKQRFWLVLSLFRTTKESWSDSSSWRLTGWLPLRGIFSRCDDFLLVDEAAVKRDAVVIATASFGGQETSPSHPDRSESLLTIDTGDIAVPVWLTTASQTLHSPGAWQWWCPSMSNDSWSLWRETRRNISVPTTTQTLSACQSGLRLVPPVAMHLASTRPASKQLG